MFAALISPPSKLCRILKDLSTGSRKKAFLITAFALKPELLLLDEPVNGLDFHPVPESSWPAVQPDAVTAEALVQAGQGFQEGGLSGPVQADQPVGGFHFEEYTDTLLKDLSTGSRKKAFLITAFANRTARSFPRCTRR